MKPAGIRFVSFLAISIFSVALPSALRASSDPESREVRISQMQGDVRLSRGDGKHINLQQSWEQADTGQLIEQGFALATQKGTAEIEFEDGSTIFLAENSLLLFPELSSSPDRLVTHITLPTGTAAFWLQLDDNESFSIETPTDGIHFSNAHDYFLRVDAYLDSTGITPLGAKIDNISRKGVPSLLIAMGKTVYFRAGSIVAMVDSHPNSPSDIPGPAGFAAAQKSNATAKGLHSVVVSAAYNLPASLFLSKPRETRSTSSPPAEKEPFHPEIEPFAGEAWNRMVEARVHEMKDTMAAALKASGLPSPIPGLAELQEHGSFFSCEPYGTCWEPKLERSANASEAKSESRETQAPDPNSSNTTFQPQLVQWQEYFETDDACDFSSGYSTVSRVAHTPEELQKLLRRKSQASSSVSFQTSLWRSCYQRNWIHHHGHYAMVLPHGTPPCQGKACKLVIHPVHPPHPVLVRVDNRIGFVPTHPDDAKGKPPINLKNGILLAPAKPGEPPQRIAWNPSQKLTFIQRTPREWNEQIAPRPVLASAPEIRGHLAQESARATAFSNGRLASPQIVYDYKTQKFMMPAAASSGAKSREVPVGGIASNGKVATFASDRQGHYAESFARTTAAATYSGGSSGSHSFSSHSFGGSSGGSGSSSSGSSHASTAGSSSHSSSSSGEVGASASSSRGSISSGSAASSGASSGATGSATASGRPHQ